MNKIILILMLAMPLQAADKLTQEEKKSFIKFYKKHTNLLSESPDKTWVKAMFADVDGDGLVDALATDALNTYEKAQSSWAIYRNVGKNWIPFKSFHKNVYEKSPKLINSASVFGRSDEFFQVIKDDGTLQFLILQRNFDKQAPEGLGDPISSWFAAGKNGIIREHKITNIGRYLAYDEENFTNPISSLIRLKVEVFDQ